MDKLFKIKTVVAVVDTQSFTGAAEKLGITKGTVSKYVSQIESEHDIRLFNRNSRKLSLTKAGERFYLLANKLLVQYDTMIEDVVNEQKAFSGKLRISSPIAFGEHVMTALLPKFNQRYPAIDVELILQNQQVDMIKAGIDIRIKSGQVNDSNMIARPLCKWPMIVCAAPQYLAINGVPQTPQQLSEHHCILDSNLDNGHNWSFVSTDGSLQTVSVPSRLASNNPQAVVNMVKNGAGIGIVAKHSVLEELTQNTLVELFTDFQTKILDIYIIYPHRKHIPQKTRCFIDFMLETLAQ